MAEMTYLEAINLGISEEMARDEKVVIFGEDVGGDKGGVFGKKAWAKYGDERCFNTPLTEGLIGGLAVGLGLMGYRAIGEFQFADYILPQPINCYQRLGQCATEQKAIGLRRSFIGPLMAAVFVVGCIILSLQKKFLGQPGLRVVTPSNPYDAKGMIKARFVPMIQSFLRT